MKCQFCNKEMIQSSIFDICKHENEMIVESSSPSTNKFRSICKNGYEIYTEKNKTILIEYKHKYQNKSHNEFYFKGYIYDAGDEDQFKLKLDHKINVSPHNFDYYLNKLLKLVPFS